MSHGVAIGEVRHMGTAVLEPPAKQNPAQDTEREQGRAHQAVKAVSADLIARGTSPVARHRPCSKRRR